jgi:hypothetical protein
MKTRAERIQDDIYAQALSVEAEIVASLASIKEAKDAAAMQQPVDQALLDAAVEDHRAAHVRWENLVVSENSMGFHHPSEVGSELSVAEQRAQLAQQKAAAALPALLFPVPVPPSMTLARSDGVPGALVAHYDVASCNAGDHLLVTGHLGDFQAAISVNCSIGSTGSHTFTPPSGDAWFLIGGVESAEYSSLGESSAGERIVSGVPAACSTIVAQNTTAICP